MGGPTVLAAAHHTLGVLHRNAALALLNEHDADDERDQRQDNQGQGDRAGLLENERALGRDLGGDAREDEQGHAVADALFRDDLAEPHDEHRTGGHDDDHHQKRPDVAVLDQHRHALAEQLFAVRQRDDAGGLQQRQRHREVAGVLRHLRLAGLAFLLQLLELRDHHGEQLHDNRGRNVRHDADGEDGKLKQRATGEQSDDGEHRRLVALGDFLQAGVNQPVIHARSGDLAADAVQKHQRKGDQDLLA